MVVVLRMVAYALLHTMLPPRPGAVPGAPGGAARLLSTEGGKPQALRKALVMCAWSLKPFSWAISISGVVPQSALVAPTIAQAILRSSGERPATLKWRSRVLR